VASPPEDLYRRQWALTLLDNVVSKLEQNWTARGKIRLFESLKPFLDDPGTKSTSQSELAGTLGMSVGSLKVVLHRLRREYRDLLIGEIAATLEDPSPANLEEELRELLRSV
jgi:hypothetical protein